MEKQKICWNSTKNIQKEEENTSSPNKGVEFSF